jgi:hypothetical protein
MTMLEKVALLAQIWQYKTVSLEKYSGINGNLGQYVKKLMNGCRYYHSISEGQAK